MICGLYYIFSTVLGYNINKFKLKIHDIRDQMQTYYSILS